MSFSTHFLLLSLLSGSVLCLYDKGYEYVYVENGIQTAGTMDHSPSAAGIAWRANVRLQFRRNKAFVEVSDLKYSQYVGPYATDHSAWKENNFVDADVNNIQYVITYDSDGKIKELAVPSSASVEQRNEIKAQAQMFQWKAKNDETYFERRENLVHGDCKVRYTVNDAVTLRSVNHLSDCVDRPFRHVDDWRGWRCDENWSEQAHQWGEHFEPGRDDPDPISSKSDAFYVWELRDGKKVVKEMGTEAGIGIRFYGNKGSSKFIYTRRNLELQEVKRSSGNINPTGTAKFRDLKYEMVNTYAWNEDRDLKASEELLDGGSLFKADQNIYIQGAMTALDEIHNNFDIHDASEENVEKLHKYGVESALPFMFGMNYNSIQSVFDTLDGDSSEEGVAKKKMFLEFLGSTGTGASALFIMDCVKGGRCFEDDQSSGRAILGIPYHVRRPNKQLVMKMKEMVDMSGLPKAVAMALPLSMAHLARRTCELAGKDMATTQFQECTSSLLDDISQDYYNKFESASGDEEKIEHLAVLQNIRWGKIPDLLKNYINTPNSDPVAAEAVTAAMYSTFVREPHTAAYFLPVITNPLLGTETRVNALTSFIWGKFDMAQLSTVANFLYGEKNAEFKNFALSLFDTFSTTLNPCFQKKRDMISFFYRYLNQIGSYSINYGLGVSKFYFQEFKSTNYENAGSNSIAIVGSTESAVPLKIMFSVMHSKYSGYAGSVLGVELRLEGLADALLQKFSKMNKREWKLSDLESLLKSMNVQLSSQKAVRVGITVTLKGTIILRKAYYGEADKASKKVMKLLNDLRGRGGKNNYNINHQRALTYGLDLYEQPTDAGTPMFYINSMTTLFNLKATVNKGISKGVLFRDLDYNIHLVTNGVDMLSFVHGKNRFQIYQTRAYRLHVPQHLVIGVNIINQELKLQMKRPQQSNPMFLVLHAKNRVSVVDLSGSGSKLATFCPGCKDEAEISNGDPQSKVIGHDDNSDYGYKFWGEYFDCEADLSDANVGGNAIYAFHPQNKNPQSFMTSLLMGLRQARTFVMFYPETAKCGAYVQWSQSSTNPVTDIQFIAQVKRQSGKEKYFYSENKILVKSQLVMTTPNGKRDHKLNIKYNNGIGGVTNELMAQYIREKSAELPAYAVCFSFENEYPELPDTFQGGDLHQQLSYSGLLKVRYGETKSCKEAQGRIVTKIKHETTPEATQTLKTKDYYKKCMEEKQSTTWQNRQALPVTPSCWLATYDASNARKYSWDIKFEGVSPEVRAYFEKGETVLKTAVLPYWDLDPKALARSLDAQPELKLDIKFKNRDKLVDVKLETDKGVSDFKDMPVNVPVLDGPLSNLRVDSQSLWLARNNLIDWCKLTDSNMRMLDNVTIPYSLDSCWSLISSHCGPNPKYAVFAKPGGAAPLKVQVYMGGHKVELTPSSPTSISVKVNGSPFNVADGETKPFKSGASEIFKLSNWGGTLLLVNPEVVIVNFDGNFVQVLPNVSTKGQHCGACGNYDGNRFNNLRDRSGNTVTQAELPTKWCK